MSVLVWIAAAWMVAALAVTLSFFIARRSNLIYRWLFGEKPTAEVFRLARTPAGSDQPTRLAA